LGIMHRTIWTLEDRHFLIRYMLVKVRVEQSLLGKNSVTHGTLVDQPANKKKKTLYIASEKSTF